MKRLSSSLCSFVLASLAGCATPPPSISDVDVNNLADNQALLVLSTGSLVSCVVKGTALVLKKLEARPTLSQSIAMFQANNPYIESDFEGHYAKVYTVVVEPGDYDIWIMVMNAYYKYPDPTVTQPIRVKPGEVKYIGEFFVEGCGKVQIYPRDRKERDLAFVQRIDPAFDPDKVTVEIFKTIEREPEDQS